MDNSRAKSLEEALSAVGLNWRHLRAMTATEANIKSVKVGDARSEPLGSSSTSLEEQTHSLLGAMIKDGRIRPGDRLVEAQIVKAFGVSRSPARRALQTLHREGVIVHDEHGYAAAGTSTPTTRRLATLQPARLSQPRRWENIYREVEREVHGKILFGSVRINDQRLAEHFGVSRTVTRDLLARMHGVGLVVKSGAGHWIAERVTPERIRHLYQMRRLLEPEALLQAAPHVPKTLLDRARANVVSALSKTPVNSAEIDRAETDLHLDILGFSANQEIFRALRRTHLLFGPTRHLVDPDLGIPMEMIEAALREHLEIIDLVAANRVQIAAAALVQHLIDATERWNGRFEIALNCQKIEFPPYLVAL